MSFPALSPRQHQMLAKLANYVLPNHSSKTGEPVYDMGAYIEKLLCAFDQKPPAIYAGGPFSGRHAVLGDAEPSNDFAQFLPLSRYQRLAWKLRLEGAEGLADEQFIFISDELKNNYTGLHQVISEGLSRAIALEDGTQGKQPPIPDALLSTAGPEFRHVFFALLAQAAFSAPEYGGNLAAWQEIFYPGDSMGAGYSEPDISQPDAAPDPFPTRPLAKLFFDLAVTFMKGRKFR